MKIHERGSKGTDGGWMGRECYLAGALQRHPLLHCGDFQSYLCAFSCNACE